LINLLFELPHPGDKYKVISSFWNGERNKGFRKYNHKFIYEEANWQRHCDPESFRVLAQYFAEEKKVARLWTIIESMLCSKSIIIVGPSSDVTVQIIEVLRSLIYP